MRIPVPSAVLLATSLTVLPLCASSRNDAPPDPQAIAALEARASQAQPRDQCYLYAQLVHDLGELSLRQYADGEVESASGMLNKIQQTVQKIHLTIAGNDKRLKNAEILLNQTSFRLNELLRSSDFADRMLVEQTINDVNHAQNEAMMQIFRGQK